MTRKRFSAKLLIATESNRGHETIRVPIRPFGALTSSDNRRFGQLLEETR
jgi:hypothetical protein